MASTSPTTPSFWSKLGSKLGLVKALTPEQERAQEIERIEDKLPLYLPEEFRDYMLAGLDAEAFEGLTCDVVSPADNEKVLYSFVVKKMLVAKQGNPSDLYRNYDLFLDKLPNHHMLPIAFDQFRNLMLISLRDGKVYFWDHQSIIEKEKLMEFAERVSQNLAHERVFRVADGFDKFRDQLYKKSRFL